MPKWLTPLALGTVAGAGLSTAAPHFSSGMRRSLRTAHERNAKMRQLGPLGTANELGPGVFKFASSENPHMPRHISDDVYVARAHGYLSDTEVAHLEQFASELQKEGSFTQGLMHGLGTAAATAVGGLAMVGAAHGINNMYDAMTFDKDLQAVLRTRPELSTYPKEQIRLVYQSLRRLSPQIAKDPLTAGTYLLRQFERRNPSDPHSLPTVELETARTLTQATGELSKKRDIVRDTLLEAAKAGARGGR